MAPYPGNLYPRAYVWNLHAQGGYNWGGNPPEGPYGLNVDPVREQPFWGNNILDFYALGAPLEKFPQPSYKFLVAENERANDNFFTSNTGPPYSVDLTGPATGYPPWSGDGGVWAFRHLRPPAVNMYKFQATANFAFIDCHVEVMNPLGKILDIYRSSMN
jgi:prepilin-type processing-associated H-X9-DG protein